MRYTKNERGVALVLVLVLSVMALAMVGALLFMLKTGAQLSASQRFYKTAEEAGTGGAEIFAEFIKLRGVALATGLSGTWITTDTCLAEKLLKTKVNWSSTACTAPEQSLLIDAADTTTYDVKFTLGSNPEFTVFGKIVDTVEGNSDTGGIVTSGELGGAGVVAANSGLVSPPQVPYLYRLEVQSQATTNPRERAMYSVLYAY